MQNYNRVLTGCFVCLFLFQIYSTVQSQTLESQPVPVQHKSSLDNKPWTVSRLSVRLGAFWAINSTDIGIGIDGRKHTSFNFENVLDMNRNTYSGLFNFNARLGKHNRIDFSYYNILRSSKATLEKEIQFGEHDYPVNSSVSAFLNTNVFRLSYGYSFYSNKKIEFGALLGFHVMLFNTGLRLNANTLSLSYKDNVQFTAPLPDIGIWGTYAFAKHWALSTELSYFYMKYKIFDGRILNAALSVQYKISKHWEIDLGYTDFDVRVGLDRKRLSGNFEWNYNGPFLTAVYKFGH